jgi:trimethylamine:corrinoid methyltransferase-like protein
MISYEHLVMVDELINQIRSITGSIATDVDSLALDAIAESSSLGGNYLGVEHALQFMKRDVYHSEFCGRIEPSDEDAHEKAHLRVKDILARRETDGHVDKDVFARLAAVEARPKEDDQTWQTDIEDWWTTYLEDLS